MSRAWPKRRARALALLALVAGCAHSRSTSTQAADSLAANRAQVWITTADQSRLLSREPDVAIRTTTADAVAVIDVNAAIEYQEMVGFGAALTDASAQLIQRLPEAQRRAILRELFGRDPGIGLSFVRVPMGSSDFSPRHYSYDDMPAGQFDSTLAHFSIEPDRLEKLPALRAALAINPQIALVASPWSPPGWMKTSGSLVGGTLRPEFHESFARYIGRFVEAYAAEGIRIHAVTLQNEPAFEPTDYPGMRLDPSARADIIGRHLGPRFSREAVRTRILDWDHNWDQPASPLAVLGDSVARRYVGGIAWHCYAGTVEAQTAVHDAHPTVDAYFTECSGGSWAPVFADNLAYDVGTLIIGATRGWARGVALWNLALDEHGGPHLGGCGNCRGVITIDSRTGTVTRNVEYYALAHASRFVRAGARRIASSTDVRGLRSVAFRNAGDRTKVLIVLNTGSAAMPLTVRDGDNGFRYEMPAGAVATMRWR